MDGLRNKSVHWALVALSLFVIISAARIGVADLLSGYARNEMYAWSVSAVRPDLSAVEAVSRALDVARLISAGNPDHYEDLARLAVVRSGMAGITGDERNAQLVEGLVHIRRAIALRPVSSYSWSILLLLKRELAQYDAEFRYALERAVTLGPWEPDVQPIVADVGLSAWAALPFAEQEMVRKNFLRGMKHQANTMIAISQSHRDDCNSERAKLNPGCGR